jgi:hypothetical protein
MPEIARRESEVEIDYCFEPIVSRDLASTEARTFLSSARCGSLVQSGEVRAATRKEASASTTRCSSSASARRWSRSPTSSRVTGEFLWSYSWFLAGS